MMASRSGVSEEILQSIETPRQSDDTKRQTKSPKKTKEIVKEDFAKAYPENSSPKNIDKEQEINLEYKEPKKEATETDQEKSAPRKIVKKKIETSNQVQETVIVDEQKDHIHEPKEQVLRNKKI